MIATLRSAAFQECIERLDILEFALTESSGWQRVQLEWTADTRKKFAQDCRSGIGCAGACAVSTELSASLHTRTTSRSTQPEPRN